MCVCTKERERRARGWRIFFSLDSSRERGSSSELSRRREENQWWEKKKIENKFFDLLRANTIVWGKKNTKFTTRTSLFPEHARDGEEERERERERDSAGGKERGHGIFTTVR